jgi:hypothetical protein
VNQFLAADSANAARIIVAFSWEVPSEIRKLRNLVEKNRVLYEGNLLTAENHFVQDKAGSGFAARIVDKFHLAKR